MNSIQTFFSSLKEEEIIIALNQYQRLCKLFGQAQALSIMYEIKKNNSLQLLNQLSEQEIICQFFESQQDKYGKYPEQNGISQNFMEIENNQFQFMEIQNQLNIQKQELSNDKKDQFRIKQQTFKLRNLYSKQFSTISQVQLNQIFKFIQYYENTSQIIKKNQLISKANSLKDKPFTSSNQIMFEYIRLVDSALYYTTKQFRLRSTQILAIILFLFRPKLDKILLQILTGEGKSTTISCLAAILSITGFNVDIVTTNDLLAKRDVEEKRQFYKVINLEVAHNFEQNQKSFKSCYTNKKIVYGTPHSFQVDILFDQYKKRGTRANRPYQILIVDQVDSMFVDQKDHQTLLASTYPGFSELVHPMKIIWNKINSFPLLVQDQRYKMLLPLGKDSVKGQAKAIMQEVVKQIRKEFNNEVIPAWRMDFIQLSLDDWIKSAVKAAFQFKQNHHYLVKNKTIVPIDYKNTGSIQEKVHWQHGLHQFLQIKHGLAVSTQGMTSNFISNLGHFDKYQKIYGLTGTLGSDQSKLFLKETYKSELMQIPPCKQRKLKIDEGIIQFDQIDWAHSIIQKIQLMTLSERSVLLICETIQQVDLIQIAINKLKNIKFKVKYLRLGQEQISDIVDCREVLIATNLAGRGTDLKITDKLNQRGGLHVIIGFMPQNLRVQMQGRGRGGRNGCEGSSQLIVNYSKFIAQIGLQKQKKIIFQNSESKQIEFACNIRDHIEKQNMKQDRSKVKQLRAKDRVFSIYCKGVNKIADFQDNHAKQLAIQQQWAMFLKRVQVHKLPYHMIQIEAQHLVQNFIQNSQSFYNANHFVQRGIHQLIKNNKEEAIKCFKLSQQNNAGSLTQITGGIYENICSINNNPKNKQVIQNGLKGLMKVKQKILHRKDVKKGLNAYDQENKVIVDHHRNQKNNLEKIFQKNINPNNNFMFNQFQYAPQLNLAGLDSKQVVEVSKIQLQDAECRILTGLENHLDEIKQKYQNLGKNQYIQFRYEPISKLLNQINGDQVQNKAALQKLQGEGLHLLPIPEIKKIKVKWWKRALVFVLGLVQFVCGALIVASTAGALTGFGATMMMEGAKDCFNALFNPEVLNDLKAYYSEKALRYTFALALSGFQGIKQLATLGQKGFTLIKNTPFTTLVKTTLETTMKGVKMMPQVFTSFKGATALLSQGLFGLRKNQKDIKEMIKNPVVEIKKNSQKLKNQIQKIIDEEDAKTLNINQITSNFEEKITKEIKLILQKNKTIILTELKNLPISNQQASIITHEVMKLGINLKEDDKKLLYLLTNNISKPNLPNLYMDYIGLDKIIENFLKKIKEVENYKNWIQITQKKLIFQSIKQVSQIKKKAFEQQRIQLTNKCNQLNQAQASIARNQQVEKFKLQQQNYENNIKQYNDLITYLNKNEERIFQIMKDKQCFETGKIVKQKVNNLEFPKLLKQILLNLRYQDSSKPLLQSIENSIYNSTVVNGVKFLQKILNDTNGIAEKVQKIAKNLINYA